MGLRILVVEDEVLISETIKLLLEEQGHLVQDSCISYEEAIEAYQKEKPDMVILDVRLYGQKSGIDFANYLLNQPEETPFIYLTSQYDRRIFELALETNPYGYLAKPIQKASLWTTVETAYQRFKERNNESENPEITVFDGQKNHRIKEEEIVWIKSDHVYAKVHLLDDRQILTRKPLSKFRDQISGKWLFQCHRSYIINIRHVSSWDNQAVTMVDGETIPVSRSKRQTLIDML
ncbi:MAG: response regulator transcription factor [Bacteroidota bacterium]